MKGNAKVVNTEVSVAVMIRVNLKSTDVSGLFMLQMVMQEELDQEAQEKNSKSQKNPVVSFAVPYIRDTKGMVGWSVCGAVSWPCMCRALIWFKRFNLN